MISAVKYTCEIIRRSNSAEIDVIGKEIINVLVCTVLHHQRELISRSDCIGIALCARTHKHGGIRNRNYGFKSVVVGENKLCSAQSTVRRKR